MDKGDGSIKYILTGEGAGTTFTIDDSTGDIHAIQRLDREVKSQYVLRAQARNRLTDRPLEPESEFIVKIQDINDNEPRFLDGPYQASVPEMSKIGEQMKRRLNATFVLYIPALRSQEPVSASPTIIDRFTSVLPSSPASYFSSTFASGTSVIQLIATDADDPTYGNSARVVYSILEGQPYFSVDAKTGMTSHNTTTHLGQGLSGLIAP